MSNHIKKMLIKFQEHQTTIELECRARKERKPYLTVVSNRHEQNVETYLILPIQSIHSQNRKCYLNEDNGGSFDWNKFTFLRLNGLFSETALIYSLIY